MYRMYVDNGSAVNIIFIEAFHRMGFTKDDLKPSPYPLFAFKITRLIPKGQTTLPVTVGEKEDKKKKVMAEFLIVDCPSAYNAILG